MVAFEFGEQGTTMLANIDVGRGVVKVRRMFDICDIDAFKAKRRRIEPPPAPRSRRRNQSQTGADPGYTIGFTAMRARRKEERRLAREKAKQESKPTEVSKRR